MVIALVLTGLSSTSFGAPPKTGTFTDTPKFSNGTNMTFKAGVPMELPKEKTLGLILAFHPHGGNGLVRGVAPEESNDPAHAATKMGGFGRRSTG